LLLAGGGGLGAYNGNACSKIDFSIETLNDIQLCYKPVLNHIEVNFIVKNTGDADIEGMSMLIIGDNGKKIQDLNDVRIKKNSLFYAENLEIQYDLNSHGSINKIYFIPKIENNGVGDICPTLLTEVEKISECA